MPRFVLIALSLLALSACASLERLAIPDNNLTRPDVKGNGAVARLDHGAWDRFLQDHTRKDTAGVVRVDYARISDSDHAKLKNYLRKLAAVDAAMLTNEAQLAYWVNFYNALTVDVILDYYPVESIRDIKGKGFDLGPWEDKRLMVKGVETSLHDIEHGIIRPLWPDVPEIHYVLNCAAVGCPNLGQRAYTAQNITETLEVAARSYVNDPRGVRVSENGQVTASKIYSWYLDDFGGSEVVVLEHIRSYASPELRVRLVGKTRIQKYEYDWDLNEF
ncbi:hypothetical protein ROA7450_02038 [Roseovarius albus]|uniref:DUF547 domain-containing protein n=1 Tax=Roseovarius albus TaxID=1247867 RepID=A0A1X6Z8L4_9RHOB|nr:DUF547 domain-containing protein [Roseovarius albus]SLN41990.1 hypothetical protein ROA7450_02038 [Roseovarius albus]